MRLRILHLLGAGGDVARGEHDALAAVVMVVEFGAEGLEHGHDGGRFHSVLALLLLALHSGVGSFVGHGLGRSVQVVLKSKLLAWIELRFTNECSITTLDDSHRMPRSINKVLRALR